ncbi:hypothetical protein THAOC_18175, partial [Thalassiosira oceanica]
MSTPPSSTDISQMSTADILALLQDRGVNVTGTSNIHAAAETSPTDPHTHAGVAEQPVRPTAMVGTTANPAPQAWNDGNGGDFASILQTQRAANLANLQRQEAWIRVGNAPDKTPVVFVQAKMRLTDEVKTALGTNGALNNAAMSGIAQALLRRIPASLGPWTVTSASVSTPIHPGGRTTAPSTVFGSCGFAPTAQPTDYPPTYIKVFEAALSDLVGNLAAVRADVTMPAAMQHAILQMPYINGPEEKIVGYLQGASPRAMFAECPPGERDLPTARFHACAIMTGLAKAFP